jgi:hypothetical protein
MKKLNKISTVLVSLAYLSPVFMAIYFREKLFQSINTGSFNLSLVTMMVIPYGIHIFRYFKSIWKTQETENQAIINRSRIIWVLFYFSVLGIGFYYANHHEPNMGYNPLLILFGIFMMIDGNYQSVILPKNIAFENGIGEGYEENVYKKSQRLKGRFQFYFGLIITILFLILPNTPKMWLYGIGGMLFTYYIGSWVFMYKNTQIIAGSEAKTK